MLNEGLYQIGKGTGGEASLPPLFERLPRCCVPDWAFLTDCDKNLSVLDC